MALDEAADKANPRPQSSLCVHLDDFMDDYRDAKAGREGPDEGKLRRRNGHNNEGHKIGYELLDAGDDKEERRSTPGDQEKDPLVRTDSVAGANPEQDLNIPEDSFSMLYVARGWRRHFLPLSIYGIQMAILSLILLNLLQKKYTPLDLKMNIPVNVAIEVTIAQYLAALVSFFTSGDFVDGILFFRKRIVCEGSSRRLGTNASESVEAGNLGCCGRWKQFLTSDAAKWEVCNLMRMSEGAFVIVVSFVFIAQSTTVIELFLNFAGVAFVSELDDVAFRLSSIGFMGTGMQHTAVLVLKHKVDHGGKGYTPRDMKRRKMFRFFSFAAIIVAMWIGLSTIVIEQGALLYACKSVTLTVGESKDVSLRSLSGTYILNEMTHARKAVYVQEQGRDEQGRGVYIAYCDKWKIKRWTVTNYWYAEKSHDADEFPYCHGPWDPCCYYDLQSKMTRTYDITEISEFLHSSGDAIDSGIKCNDCTINNGDGDKESCGWEGTCVETSKNLGVREIKIRKCDCHNHFGDSCQFKGPCTELGFQGDEFPGYSKSFNLLYDEDRKPLMVYDRPVYELRNPSSPDLDDLVVLLFDGGRWQVIWFDDWDPSKGETIEQFLMKYKYNPLRPILGGFYSVDYLSDESNEGSPTYVPFRASFSDKDSATSVGRLGDKEFVLLCADCKLGGGDDDGNEGGGNSSVLQISKCQNSQGSEDRNLCQAQYSSYHNRNVTRCNCEDGFIGPLYQTHPVEGKLFLYLEHGKNNSCSVCGENNMWTVWDLVGLPGKATCLPFPREPLIFDAGNGTAELRQLGLNLNKTHFSVIVSNNGRFFRKGDNAGASESICRVPKGSIELFAIERRLTKLKEQTHLDLAILLERKRDFFGEVIDPGGIDCLFKSNVDEHACDGSKELSLRQVYDPTVNASELMRVWMQFDLKVTH